MSPDRCIARLAAGQFGVFTYVQALNAGLSPDDVAYRLRSGRWRRIHKGVYALAGAPVVFEQRALAATLAGGAGVAASHLTAGALFRVEGVASKVIEIIAPRSRRVRIEGIRVHHINLKRGDIGRKSGVPLTSPMRTIIDLASVLDDDSLEDALDDMVRRKLVRPRELELRLEDMPRRGCKGSALLLRLVKKRTTRKVSGSNRENRVRRILERARAPAPTVQFEIYDDLGRFVARPDLSYPEQRVYIEYDGDWHLTPRQRDVDLDRVNRLSALGWRPLIFTDADLKRPVALLVERVRQTLSCDGSRR